MKQVSGARRSAAPRPVVARMPGASLGPRAKRTIVQIKDATREVLLASGYAGTTVEEIARVAGVSRASFYSYFPSKREVMLAVGAVSARECLAAIGELSSVAGSRSGLERWVGQYFEFLDTHGSFALAWIQAAHVDDELRRAGMSTHLILCRRFGDLLGTLASSPHSDPRLLGLGAFSILERGWEYSRLYTDVVDREDVVAQVATTIWSSLRPVSATVRSSRRN